MLVSSPCVCIILLHSEREYYRQKNYGSGIDSGRSHNGFRVSSPISSCQVCPDSFNQVFSMAFAL